MGQHIKWGKPCYMDSGANVVLLQGFKDYCAMLFFKGALLGDREGLRVAQSRNTQVTRSARIARCTQRILAGKGLADR